MNKDFQKLLEQFIQQKGPDLLDQLFGRTQVDLEYYRLATERLEENLEAAHTAHGAVVRDLHSKMQHMNAGLLERAGEIRRLRDQIAQLQTEAAYIGNADDNNTAHIKKLEAENQRLVGVVEALKRDNEDLQLKQSSEADREMIAALNEQISALEAESTENGSRIKSLSDERNALANFVRSIGVRYDYSKSDQASLGSVAARINNIFAEFDYLHGEGVSTLGEFVPQVEDRHTKMKTRLLLSSKTKKLTGYIVQDVDSGDRTMIEMSAVRYLTNAEFNDIMHPKTVQVERDEKTQCRCGVSYDFCKGNACVNFVGAKEHKQEEYTPIGSVFGSGDDMIILEYGKYHDRMSERREPTDTVYVRS